MKKHLQKLLFIMAMMVVPWVTQAQSSPLSEYTVTTDVTTFNSIASTGTSLSFSSQDDGYATTTFPFAFTYGTTQFNAGTSIACSANGFLRLGATSTSSTTASYSSSSDCFITALLQQDAHMGRNTGAGAYTRYDATAGTFTIEYHLLGTYSSPYGAYSYQIVFHTNGTIEIIYDSVNLGGASSRTFATYLTDGPNNDRLYLTGSWTNPTQSTSYASRPISPLPTHGLRYTFSLPNFACPRPTSLAASDLSAYGFSINWTDTSSATSWLVQLSEGNSVIVDTVTTSQTYTFTGLTPNSYYNVHVSGLCLNGDTSIYRSIEVHTLCVAIDSLPYTYGFEDLSSTGSGTPLNPCWDRGYWSGSYNPNSYPYASTTCHTGSRSLYFYGYGTTNRSWVCLPQFEDSISNLRITFWAKKSSASYSGQINVGVMSNPADYTTFQNVATLFTDYTTNWQLFDVAMHNAPNTGLITIMVEAGSTSSNYIYLDDITVDQIPYCTTPIVDSVEVTTTTANLYLSDVDNATTLTLTLSHGSWDSTIYAAGSPIALSDLQPRTQYTYELYANCGSDSSLVRRGMFSTSCSPITHEELPYTNGFEDIVATGSGTPLAPCWNRGYWSGSYNPLNYPYASTTNHTGSRSLYFYSYSTSTFSWLCLPEFEDSINNMQISVWAKKSSSDYSGQIKVGVMTDPTDYTTFQTVTTIATDATTNWNNFDIILSTAPGTGYITFMIEAGPTNYNYIYLDDITVSEVPQCPHVQNLAIDSIYVDWAAISWSEMGTATTWVIEYDTVDFVPGTSTSTFNDIVYDSATILYNLDTGRTYYLYLRADCSGDTSTYMSLTFTTLNGVPATVPYICTFEGSGSNGWEFANGTQTNYWCVGSGTNNGGNKSMYITTNGIDNTYNISSTSNVYAYREIYLPDTGDYVYSFDWKNQGESCCDYMRVALMPSTFEPVAGNSSGWTSSSGT
ncbi:MAG: fibronectin type III domain-containing protein, partial [Bacteroidales bacterium]|nr:fibronectin type III domain-containing protein [Bacteroidales bacterium]